MYTCTFSRRQMRELAAGLQILLDGKLLDEDEKKGAERLIGKFKMAKVGEYRLPGGEPYATVYISEGDGKLLKDVEASLWQR